MATVATLAVNVIAQTGGFNKGLDKAGAKAKGFGKSVGGASGGMAKMVPVAAAAAAAIAAVNIVAAKVGEAFVRLDETAKKARSMGMAAQDLMELQHAAKLAGLDADKFNTTMQKLQKGVGEAAAGVGMAGGAFERMGINLDDIIGMSLDEQFHVVAESISTIQNPAERSAAAIQIFGRSGMDLIAMMEGGSGAIKAQQEDLKRLQGELSAFDLKKVEDSNDAWTNFGTAMEGIWNQLAVAVAPLMEFIGNGLANIAGWIARIIDAWNSLVGIETEVVAPVENVEAHLAAMEKEAAAAAAALKAREELEQKGASLMESLRNPMEQYNDTLANLNSMLDAGVISWDTYGRAVEKAQDDVKKSSEFAAKEVKMASEKSVGAAVRGKTGTYSIQLKQQKELKKIREEEKKQLDQLKQQTSLLKELNKNVKTGTVVTI
tara:strand:+ start:2447 stop:3748 length:1302 start_codon:yes stop_codon:yes gene_type:complete